MNKFAGQFVFILAVVACAPNTDDGAKVPASFTPTDSPEEESAIIVRRLVPGATIELNVVVTMLRSDMCIQVQGEQCDERLEEHPLGPMLTASQFEFYRWKFEIGDLNADGDFHSIQVTADRRECQAGVCSRSAFMPSRLSYEGRLWLLDSPWTGMFSVQSVEKPWAQPGISPTEDFASAIETVTGRLYPVKDGWLVMGAVQPANFGFGEECSPDSPVSGGRQAKRNLPASTETCEVIRNYGWSHGNQIMGGSPGWIIPWVTPLDEFANAGFGKACDAVCVR